MKYGFLLLITAFSLAASAQDKEAQEIKSILAQQANEWNNGSLHAFMQPYWQSDSLMFIGSSGVTRGWLPTLENYKKNYPDKAAMGNLSFDILDVKRLSPDYYFVVGKWMLQRAVGDVSGHFTVLWKKIEGRWVIVADHSS